jgi:cell volume regulation protein A
MIYTVSPGSRVALRGVRRLLQLEGTSLVGVVRDGRLLRPRDLDRLDPGDSVLVIAPPAQAAALDELFAGQRQAAGAATFGEFMFDGDLPVGKIAEFYDLPVPAEDQATALADFVQARLRRKPLVGDRIRLADIELIVRGIRGGRIAEVGIELEPQARPRPSFARLRAWIRRRLRSPRLGGRWRPRTSDPKVADDDEPGQRQQERQ